MSWVNGSDGVDHTLLDSRGRLGADGAGPHRQALRRHPRWVGSDPDHPPRGLGGARERGRPTRMQSRRPPPSPPTVVAVQ
jgi:hypothetical protein